MTARDEKIASLDAFMAARKQIVRPDVQGDWLPGHSPNEKQLKWPISVDGVIHPGAALMIVGDPSRRDRLFFRIEILCPAAICRLDYTDETHPNSLRQPNDGVPPMVWDEHYHSWPINRRFFKDFDHPVRLANAIPYPGGGRNFDAVLRWFCDDTNIEPPPTNHNVALPRRETLL